MLNFFEFFDHIDDSVILETATVAQYLRSSQEQQLVQLLRNKVREELPKNRPFFTTPVGRKLFDRYVNFFTYQIMIDQSFQGALKQGANPPITRLMQIKQGLSPNPETPIKYAVGRAGGALTHMWQQWGDYFVSMGDNIASKINSTDYTPGKINQEVQEWHEELASQARGKPSQEGTLALDLGSIGWKGWHWLSLDKGYCSDEARAMGHCGNTGATKGDNILSLRDPEGYAHLTFIVNNKMLGEAKGRGNAKPVKRYHPAIIALLKSDWIGTIKGGGYLPENNFTFEDLNKNEQQEIMKQKPHMNDWFEYMFSSAKDNKSLLEMLNSNGFEFENIEDKGEKTLFGSADKQLIIETVNDLKELYESIKNSTSKVEDFSYWEDPEPMDFPSGDIKDLLDWTPSDITDKLEAYFKKELGDEYEEDNLEEYIENDDEIKAAFERAESWAMDSGTQGEAWKDIQKQLSDTTENGFYVDFSKHPWRVSIDLSDLKSLWKTLEKNGESLDHLKEYYDFEYNQPYNGYSDFDKDHFIETLKDELHSILNPKNQA